MTFGLRRLHQSGNFHFITFSCAQRLPHLADGASRDLFEDALERVRIRYLFVVLGYVVMPEHVHLLVSEPKICSIDKVMQALKLSVARRSRVRPFWQPRSYDFNVWNPEKTSEKLDYMHRNPVKRGLVKDERDWKWSSYRHYLCGERGTVEIESFWTAERRGYELPDAQVSKARPGAPRSEEADASRD